MYICTICGEISDHFIGNLDTAQACPECHSLEHMMDLEDMADDEIESLIEDGIGYEDELIDFMRQRHDDETWLEEGVKDLNKMYPREM